MACAGHGPLGFLAVGVGGEPAGQDGVYRRHLAEVEPVGPVGGLEVGGVQGGQLARLHPQEPQRPLLPDPARPPELRVRLHQLMQNTRGWCVEFDLVTPAHAKHPGVVC